MDQHDLKARTGTTWKEIADVCGIRHVSVLRWKVIPAKYLLALETAFGIPREEMRPDLFVPRSSDLGPLVIPVVAECEAHAAAHERAAA